MLFEWAISTEHKRTQLESPTKYSAPKLRVIHSLLGPSESSSERNGPKLAQPNHSAPTNRPANWRALEWQPTYPIYILPAASSLPLVPENPSRHTPRPTRAPSRGKEGTGDGARRGGGEGRRGRGQEEGVGRLHDRLHQARGGQDHGDRLAREVPPGAHQGRRRQGRQPRRLRHHLPREDQGHRHL